MSRPIQADTDSGAGIAAGRPSLWPLVLAAAAWVLWMSFLVMMMMQRVSQSPH